MVVRYINAQTIWLRLLYNGQPNSVTVGANKFAGTLSYQLQFDNRPTNIISEVVSENIEVNDTYPGDVFTTIPVIGRKTGPVLQYLGGRTEHRRDVSLSFVMDYTLEFLMDLVAIHCYYKSLAL